MKEEDKKVLAIIDQASSQLDMKKQIDVAYSQGVADGWKQAFEYIKVQLEQMNALEEQENQKK